MNMFYNGRKKTAKSAVSCRKEVSNHCTSVVFFCMTLKDWVCASLLSDNS